MPTIQTCPRRGCSGDAYLLFGPDADWEEIPTDLIAWGAPVVTNIDGLTKQLDDLWAGQ